MTETEEEVEGQEWEEEPLQNENSVVNIEEEEEDSSDTTDSDPTESLAIPIDAFEKSIVCFLALILDLIDYC